jgi:hypothetical protein
VNRENLTTKDPKAAMWVSRKLAALAAFLWAPAEKRFLKKRMPDNFVSTKMNSMMRLFRRFKDLGFGRTSARRYDNNSKKHRMVEMKNMLRQ